MGLRMNEKKIIGRSAALTLGLICIILIALIALIAYFARASILAQNNYNNLQNQNEQLKTWLDGNETLLNQTHAWLEGYVTVLNQVRTDDSIALNNFTEIVNLNKSVILVNGEEDLPTNIEENIEFAGYISFQINLDANVEVSYVSHGLRYDNTTLVPHGTVQLYPVLPSKILISLVEVPFILSDVISSVTITYYY